jgi:hypothetical protein
MSGRPSGYAGAAGGSVWIVCKYFSGKGKVTANGANRSHNSYGGGSGGRIAIYATSAYTYSGIVRAVGGYGNHASRYGSAGTVFLVKGGANGLTRHLIYDNIGQCSDRQSRFQAIDDEVINTLEIRGCAKVRLTKENNIEPISADRITYKIDNVLGSHAKKEWLYVGGDADFHFGFSATYYAEPVGRANWTVKANNFNPELTFARGDVLAVGTAILDQVNVDFKANSVTYIPKMLRICRVQVLFNGVMKGLEETSYCLDDPPVISGTPSSSGGLGSISIKGCGHPGALNYDSSATWTPKSPGACKFAENIRLGCTYRVAHNFDKDANLDDFSCDIPEMYNPNPSP